MTTNQEIEEQVEGFWKSVCRALSGRGFWLRLGVSDDSGEWCTEWGQLLLIPTIGYLEGPCGPMRFRNVSWIDVATLKVYGGIRGIARRTESVRNDIFVVLDEAGLAYTVESGRWSVGLHELEDEPVELVRLWAPMGV